jgi:hypothetical protein
MIGSIQDPKKHTFATLVVAAVAGTLDAVLSYIAANADRKTKLVTVAVSRDGKQAMVLLTDEDSGALTNVESIPDEFMERVHAVFGKGATYYYLIDKLDDGKYAAVAGKKMGDNELLKAFARGLGRALFATDDGEYSVAFRGPDSERAVITWDKDGNTKKVEVPYEYDGTPTRFTAVGGAAILATKGSKVRTLTAADITRDIDKEEDIGWRAATTLQGLLIEDVSAATRVEGDEYTVIVTLDGGEAYQPIKVKLDGDKVQIESIGAPFAWDGKTKKPAARRLVRLDQSGGTFVGGKDEEAGVAFIPPSMLSPRFQREAGIPGAQL